MSKNAIQLPSQAYLQETFDYDPETGVLRWKSRPREHFSTESRWKYHCTRFAGRLAGSEKKHNPTIRGRGNSNYLRVSLKVGDKNRYIAGHRLIWTLMRGEIPVDHEVDHIDLDGLNNRWSNLRLATPAQNLWNAPLRIDNKTGFKGVAKYRNGFQAYITANGRRISLGGFPTAELANAARMQAATHYHGQFNRLQ